MPRGAADTALVEQFSTRTMLRPRTRSSVRHILPTPTRAGPDKGRNISRTGGNAWPFGETELEGFQPGVSVTAVTIFTARAADW